MFRLSTAVSAAPPRRWRAGSSRRPHSLFDKPLERRWEAFLRPVLRVSKNGAEYVLRPAGRAPITRALFVGTGDIQPVVWPVSVDCSAPSSAIARDARSRSKTAAITPHTRATTNAIQEKRVSQRSAARPA
jgi:hypothetical protein